MSSRLHILLTRDARGNAETARQLQLEGWSVTCWEAFASQALPVADWPSLCSGKDWLVFTSATAVRFFFAANAVDACQHLRVACVGQRTADVVRSLGLKVDVVAAEASSAGLARETVFSKTTGLKILFPQAEDGREDFFQALADRHQITRVACYTKTFFPLPSDIRTQILNGRIDLVLLYSPSVVRQFLRAMHGHETVLNRLKIAVIGATTAAELSAAGFSAAFCANADSNALLSWLRRLPSP